MIDAPPRMLIRGADPKDPVTLCIDSPATRPSNIRDTSATPSIFIFSIFTEVDAPVKTLFFIF